MTSLMDVIQKSKMTNYILIKNGKKVEFLQQKRKPSLQFNSLNWRNCFIFSIFSSTTILSGFLDIQVLELPQRRIIFLC